MAEHVVLNPVSNSSGETKGTISFSTDVIAKVAGLALKEVPGIAGVAPSIADGIQGIWGKNNAKKGITVVNDNDQVTISVNIIGKYGSSLQEIAAAAQTEIKNAVEHMTGANVVAVNITVQGIELPGTKPEEKQPDKQD